MEKQELRKRADKEETRIQRDELRSLGVPVLRQDFGSDSPFTAAGYVPDEWKAYFEFSTVRSFPNFAGPAMSGNYSGVHPEVLAQNHASLVHQQINFDHKLKAYRPDDVSRDRIVGCCVATHFPKPPLGRAAWDEIPESAEDAPELHALAVLFKLAEGVNHFLGDHLSGKRPRAVSIEMFSDLENLGIYVPSTREVYSLLDAPDELMAAVSPNDKFGGLALGKTAGGEQLVWAYGGRNGKVNFTGTGITPTPADPTAKIHRILASREGTDRQGEICSLGAEAVPELLVGGRARMKDTLAGDLDCRIDAVATSGRVWAPGHGGYFLNATAENPVLTLTLPSSQFRIIKPLTDVVLV